MLSWPDIFQKFKGLSTLIIGDVMVDAYIWGVVERMSPEAPVPVINLKKRDYRLGGAANVALNILSMGARPVLCALAGDDENGKLLSRLMDEKGITKEGIVTSRSRPTTVKARVIAAHQQVVRIDDESDAVATPEEESELLKRIASLLPACQVVIFEDYDKGVITQKVIKETVRMASAKGIPVVVDPKKRNFMFYENVTLFKPNLKELREGLKIDVEPGDNGSVSEAVDMLKTRLGVQGVMLTMSERGIYIDFQNQKLNLPAHAREIADVSGAGDTVISIAALAVALKLSPRQIAQLSNLGGGLVCQYIGVVPVDEEELLREAIALSDGQ